MCGRGHTRCKREGQSDESGALDHSLTAYRAGYRRHHRTTCGWACNPVEYRRVTVCDSDRVEWRLSTIGAAVSPLPRSVGFAGNAATTGETRLHHYRRWLWAEPSHRKQYRAFFVFAPMSLLGGLAQVASGIVAELGGRTGISATLGIGQMLFGLALLLLGGAEFLPVAQWRLAGVLRIAYQVLMVFFAVVIWASLISNWPFAR